jgi:hypothetical protein
LATGEPIAAPTSAIRPGAILRPSVRVVPRAGPQISRVRAMDLASIGDSSATESGRERSFAPASTPRRRTSAERVALAGGRR